MCFLDLSPQIWFETLTCGGLHIALRGLPLTSRSLLTVPGPIQNSKPGPRHTTCINSSKIHFEFCLGKALCTSVGDSHQSVWCCFLAILDVGERKFVSSSSEATWITKCSGISHKSLCLLLPPLRVADFGVPISVSPCPFMSFSEVISVLSVHFGLWNKMPGTAGWTF